MKLAFFAGWLALFTVVLAFPAAASIGEAMPLEALVDAADHVVVAEAVFESARWDGPDRIVTDVRLVVEESMKGSLRPGDETVLTLLGGVVGEVGMRVTGEAQLPVGSRALLFGEERARAAMAIVRPVGMAQGVLPVVREGGRDLVEPGGRGLHLVRRGPGGLVPAAGALASRRPLDEVRADILRHLGARP